MVWHDVGEIVRWQRSTRLGFNLCLLFVSADIRHSERDMPCIVVLQVMLTLPLWTRFRLAGCYSAGAPKLQLSDARVVSTGF